MVEMDGQRTRRSGRRPGRHDTPADILAAARACFAEFGFAGTTMRRVATRAGIDAAMVHRHFGNKQQLLLAAIGLPRDLSNVLVSTVADGDLATTGIRIVCAFVELWDSAPLQDASFSGLLRLAIDDPVSTAALRDYLTVTIKTGLTRALGDRPSDHQIGRIGSQLLGIAVARYVIKLEPFASATPRQIAAQTGWIIQHQLLTHHPPGRRLRNST